MPAMTGTSRRNKKFRTFGGPPDMNGKTFPSIK